jgi:hypothetical protein
MSPYQANPQNRIAARYPKDRAVLKKYRRDLGTVESTFAECAITGFIIPWLPSILGFRPFGKGIGGIFRTTIVGTITGLQCASVIPF